MSNKVRIEQYLIGLISEKDRLIEEESRLLLATDRLTQIAAEKSDINDEITVTLKRHADVVGGKVLTEEEFQASRRPEVKPVIIETPLEIL